MPAEQVDYVELALGSHREDFVRACNFPFLVGVSRLSEPAGPQRTASFDLLNEVEVATLDDPVAALEATASAPMVLAVRKAHSVFPTMITLGRTSNNDIVVRDTKISKFHAFFRIGAHVELYDAGSRNGTWHGLERLLPKGAPAILESGDLVRFGPLPFTFYNASDLWDHLHGKIR